MLKTSKSNKLFMFFVFFYLKQNKCETRTTIPAWNWQISDCCPGAINDSVRRKQTVTQKLANFTFCAKLKTWLITRVKN